MDLRFPHHFNRPSIGHKPSHASQPCSHMAHGSTPRRSCTPMASVECRHEITSSEQHDGDSRAITQFTEMSSCLIACWSSNITSGDTFPQDSIRSISLHDLIPSVDNAAALHVVNLSFCSSLTPPTWTKYQNQNQNQDGRDAWMYSSPCQFYTAESHARTLFTCCMGWCRLPLEHMRRGASV